MGRQGEGDNQRQGRHTEHCRRLPFDYGKLPALQGIGDSSSGNITDRIVDRLVDLVIDIVVDTVVDFAADFIADLSGAAACPGRMICLLNGPSACATPARGAAARVTVLSRLSR